MNPGRAFGDNIEPLRPPGGTKPQNHVITLASLSEQLPINLVSQQLARSLCAETKASTILVRFKVQTLSADGQGIPEQYLNGEFHLPQQLAPSEGGFCSLTIGVRSEPPSPAGLDSLISQLSRIFRYVLIEVGVARPPAPWIFELLRRSDLAYLFLKATNDDVYHLDIVTRGARNGSANGGPPIKPIGCLSRRVDPPVHIEPGLIVHFRTEETHLA